MILSGTSVQDNTGKNLLRTSGSILNYEMFFRNNEISLSSSSNGTHWTVTYNKLYGSSVSYLIVKTKLAMTDRYNGNCGHGISWNGNFDTNQCLDYRFDNWNPTNNHVFGLATNTSLGSGNVSIAIRWVPNDGGSNLPSYWENPGNGRADSRRRANGSVIHVWEVKV
jgi:hypothetical protein